MNSKEVGQDVVSLGPRDPAGGDFDVAHVHAEKRFVVPVKK